MRWGMPIIFLSLGSAGAVLAQAQTAPSLPPVPAPATDAPSVQAPSTPDAAITADRARSIALSFADKLESNYVFPDIAKRYAEALRAKANAGGYDGAGKESVLADQLTADLRAVSPDNHLRVITGSPDVLRPRPAAGGPPRPALVPIEEARWLAPGIAYIRFTAFPADPAVSEAAAKFMADHADAKTLILDVRTHRGGGLGQMDAIFPYLFEKPTALVLMDTRTSVAAAGGNPFEGSATLRRIPANEDVVRYQHSAIPHPTEKRLFNAKIFVLTSGFTASAAEHFSLSMKRTGRATHIGESTGGARHYGGFQPIGGNFSAFIPVGRTFDPDTGKGWEGGGVEPHIAVPAERALVEALVRSGIAPAEAERLSAEVQPKGPMRRIRPAR
jgi:hypothetical protein